MTNVNQLGVKGGLGIALGTLGLGLGIGRYASTLCQKIVDLADRTFTKARQRLNEALPSIRRYSDRAHITPVTHVKKYLYSVLGTTALAAIISRTSFHNGITLLTLGAPLLGFRELNAHAEDANQKNQGGFRSALCQVTGSISRIIHGFSAIQTITGYYSGNNQRFLEGIRSSLISTIFYGIILCGRTRPIADAPIVALANPPNPAPPQPQTIPRAQPHPAQFSLSADLSPEEQVQKLFERFCQPPP